MDDLRLTTPERFSHTVEQYQQRTANENAARVRRI